jgi:hypothetical protein
MYFLPILLLLTGCCSSNEDKRERKTSTKQKLFSAGSAHNCFIQTDDTVKCFVSPYFNIKPEDTANLKAKTLSAGEVHNCAILQDDTVACWNDKEIVEFGVAPNKRNMRANFQIIEGKKVIDIAAGGFHTCAIKADNNEVVCWGDNNRDQQTTIAQRFKGKKVKAIEAGSDNLCGITFQNKIICSDEEAEGFDKIKNLEVKSIESNDGFFCAFTINDNVRCWGKIPNKVNAALKDTIKDQKVDRLAVSSEDICLIIAGERQVHCYGGGSYGQINLDKIADLNKLNPKAVYAGAFHICVVDEEDKVHCQGSNASLSHIKDIEGLKMKSSVQ